MDVILNGVVLREVKGEPGLLEFCMTGPASVKIGGTIKNGDCVLLQPDPMHIYHLAGTYCKIHKGAGAAP